MIYPAEYNITILQNSTWTNNFRVTQNRRALVDITINAGTPTFNLPCHGFTAGSKVVFTGGTTVPCGLSLNSVYYVISAGLTTDAFQVSASDGGSSISVSGSSTGTFYVAEPINITGYTIDGDIKQINSTALVATFVPSLINATNGEFSLSLGPTVTAALTPKQYAYDVSLTSGGGERYYWLKGIATVQLTYSRN